MRRFLAFVDYLVIVAVVATVLVSVRRPESAPVPTEIVREVVRAESVFVHDTVRLTRLLTRWDTVRVTDTIVVNGIVYVPRIVVDSIVEACRPLPTSCETLVTAVRDSAKAIGDRGWQAIGLTYPRGLFYERDRDRLRLGTSLRFDVNGKLQGEIRGGVRW